MLGIQDTDHSKITTVVAQKNVIQSQAENMLLQRQFSVLRRLPRYSENAILILRVNNTKFYLSNNQYLDYLNLS